MLIVYLATNIANGKRYVGQTSHSLAHRWKSHLAETWLGSHTHFHNAIRKYGEEYFKLEVLFTDSNKDTIDFYEKNFIRFYRTRDRNKGYNLTDGGDGGFRQEEK